MIKRIIVAIVGALSLVFMAGCSSDADTVNQNLSTDAEQFNIERTIVFYNGITDTYIAVIEGRCSVERDGAKMQAICKVGPNEYTRDEVGLSDNVTYYVLQTKPAAVDDFHKKVVLKPGATLPDFDVETGSK